MNKSKTIFLTRCAVIAALYATLTLVLAPISYGPIQVRVSEALTILPLFYLESIPALAIGCFFANIVSGPVDMVLGTIATLVAAVLTRFSKKIYFGVFPPVILNALIVPAIFIINSVSSDAYYINMLTVGLGELISVVVLGTILYFVLKKSMTRYSVLRPIDTKLLFKKKKKEVITEKE